MELPWSYLTPQLLLPPSTLEWCPHLHGVTVVSIKHGSDKGGYEVGDRHDEPRGVDVLEVTADREPLANLKDFGVRRRG